MVHLIALVILIYKVITISTLDIKKAKVDACEHEAPITAILESKYNRDVAFLFSKDYTWTLDIESGTLIKVNRTLDMFKNVSGGVDAGVADRFDDDIFLVNDIYGYRVRLNYTEPIPYQKFIKYLGWLFIFDMVPEQLVCSATYLVGPTKTHVLFVFQNGIVYECYRQKNEGEYPSQEPCKNTGGDILNPNNIKLSGQCEGLMIDEGPHNPLDRTFTLDPVTKYDFSDKSEYRILLADEKSLRYWKGEELIYDNSFGQLFDCTSALTAILVIGSMVTLVIVAISAAALLFVMVKFGRSDMAMIEGNTTTTVTRNIQRTVSKPVVGAKVHKT